MKGKGQDRHGLRASTKFRERRLRSRDEPDTIEIKLSHVTHQKIEKLKQDQEKLFYAENHKMSLKKAYLHRKK